MNEIIPFIKALTTTLTKGYEKKTWLNSFNERGENSYLDIQLKTP